MPPFLTDIDPRGAVKGTRDPLGIQPIWTRFARHIIGNLTNASNNARDFTVLILGCHFAAKISAERGPETELQTFLKWEQLAAYARAEINQDRSFRGTERVAKNLATRTVTLSAGMPSQILSDQKSYGIWGLYSVPGRASGLLEGHPARLTPEAQAIVDDFYLPTLSRFSGASESALIDLLARDTNEIEIDRPNRRRPLEAVAAILKPEFTTREQIFYQRHLLEGGPFDTTDARQIQLTELLRSESKDGDIQWTPTRVRQLAKVAEKYQWKSLAEFLSRIAITERLLAPVSELFTYLLGCDGTAIDAIVGRMRDDSALGAGIATISIDETREVKDEIGAGDSITSTRWFQLAESLRTGDYRAAITHLVEQNRQVMQARGGAAWLEIEKNSLKVRVQEESGRLPSAEDLKEMWHFPYFLNSHRSIATALSGGSLQ